MIILKKIKFFKKNILFKYGCVLISPVLQKLNSMLNKIEARSTNQNPNINKTYNHS